MTEIAVGFSTSSPQTSVAIFGPDNRLLWSGERMAPRAASGVAIELLSLGLEACGHELGEAALFLADLGPGSFTGVRVGIVLAKTLAFAADGQVAGADAFDLIAPTEVAYISSRREELLIREPNSPPFRSSSAPQGAIGYADHGGAYPHAAGFLALWDSLEWGRPEDLLPNYVLEPSISQPKRPFGVIGA